MKVAVIGLGFGDEGKGAVTDFLCSRDSRSTVVVRFSGGHQAAHTVVSNNVEHVFSNFGSGTLRGCPTYWSEFCTFEPRGFWKELSILRDKKVRPQIFIHNRCKVTTPYDIVANWYSRERGHGTTGTGFWKTLERNQNGVELDALDLFGCSVEQLREDLKGIAEYYSYVRRDEELMGMLDEFYDCVAKIKNEMLSQYPRSDISLFINYPKSDVAHPLAVSKIVFEGSQGLLLDKDLGFFPHVTPSKTNLDNVIALGYAPQEVFLVTRVYQTRHGEGPMTNVGISLEVADAYERATRENPYQGRLRKTVLDLDLLERAVRLGVKDACTRNRITKNLVVTCMDQVVGEFLLTHGGKLIKFHEGQDFIKYIGKVLEIDGNLYGKYGLGLDPVCVAAGSELSLV